MMERITNFIIVEWWDTTTWQRNIVW
jgi:hypothetical protein